MSSKAKGEPSLRLKRREDGFSSNVKNEKLREYNALHDPNMRHFFENRKLQQHLYRTGMIDTQGRVIDFEKNKAKIAIIEQEFRMAEKAEDLRQKEEEEMRRRVQAKRKEALEHSRKAERLQKLKEDQKIRRQIIQATRQSQGVEYKHRLSESSKSSRSQTLQQTAESFFLTETNAEEPDMMQVDVDGGKPASAGTHGHMRPESSASYASDFTDPESNNDALDRLVEQQR